MASVRKRSWKNGDGSSTVKWAVDFFDANDKRQRRQFDTRREADDFRVEMESQLRLGTYRAEADKLTVKELAERYLAYCKARNERGEKMTSRTYQVYEGYVRNYICPDSEWHARKHNKPSHSHTFFRKGIGQKTLSQLTVGAINQFRDDLREAGLSASTRRKIITMLKVMLDYAIGQDLLAFNAAEDIQVISTRADEAKKIIPPPKEMVRELIDLGDERFRTIVLFAASTGVRAGELHALRWRHIDFERREVSIETRVDALGDEDVPKTTAGIRHIPLGEGLLSALRHWRQLTRFSQDDDLVFPNFLGKYWNHDGMVKAKWKPLFKRLAERWKEQRRNDMPKYFNWHALRHFAISCWIDAGLPPKTVQTFAGHASLQITMDRYGHLFRSERHNAAMDAITDGIKAERPAEKFKNQNRKWSDFGPK
ncbi:MAG: hypothetical protein A4S14_14610 [Proteobacteria bacterium SG_bin9]|nr:MAG: hypothetical protein A4S14_14610 [Proteobacteria bacterium SG_bin9]